MFFFVVAPFCSCPASLVSRKFFAVGPGCAKCVFFCCAPLGAATFRRGRSKKKNTPGWCFFFCCGPTRTLTLRPHSLRAWVAMPPPRRGGVFFLLRPRPDRGGVFFFAVAPPGRSLTHCGLGRFRQGPGGVFFLLRPRRVFLDNNKKCLGYYIESKKTRRGHSKKKKHHFRQTLRRTRAKAMQVHLHLALAVPDMLASTLNRGEAYYRGLNN